MEEVVTTLFPSCQRCWDIVFNHYRGRLSQPYLLVDCLWVTILMPIQLFTCLFIHIKPLFNCFRQFSSTQVELKCAKAIMLFNGLVVDTYAEWSVATAVSGSVSLHTTTSHFQSNYDVTNTPLTRCSSLVWCALDDCWPNAFSHLLTRYQRHATRHLLQH